MWLPNLPGPHDVPNPVRFGPEGGHVGDRRRYGFIRARTGLAVDGESDPRPRIRPGAPAATKSISGPVSLWAQGRRTAWAARTQLEEGSAAGVGRGFRGIRRAYVRHLGGPGFSDRRVVWPYWVRDRRYTVELEPVSHSMRRRRCCGRPPVGAEEEAAGRRLRLRRRGRVLFV
jgi:hypothetical protein